MERILYFSRNPNPRLATAVARYLQAPVRLEWACHFLPAERSEVQGAEPHAAAAHSGGGWAFALGGGCIACRLSMMTGSNFWRMDAETPEMIRWISWAKANFVWACDIVHFEFGTKQRYKFGPVDQDKVTEGEAIFHKSAEILNDHLEGRMHLLDSGLSYADFRMATFLPFNDAAGLPVADYPNVERWYEGLLRLPGWADPFEGLHAPELPAVPKRES